MQNSQTPNTTQNGTPTDSQPTVTKKSRHGCLTTWLILIIIANIIIPILVVMAVNSNPGKYPGWVIPLEIIFGVWAVVCALALFMWKKWGFYGFCVGAVATIIIYIVIGSYAYVFTPLISLGLLYAVLNIGAFNKGWPQLE